MQMWMAVISAHFNSLFYSGKCMSCLPMAIFRLPSPRCLKCPCLPPVVALVFLELMILSSESPHRFSSDEGPGPSEAKPKSNKQKCNWRTATDNNWAVPAILQGILKWAKHHNLTKSAAILRNWNQSQIIRIKQKNRPGSSASFTLSHRRVESRHSPHLFITQQYYRSNCRAIVGRAYNNQFGTNNWTGWVFRSNTHQSN